MTFCPTSSRPASSASLLKPPRQRTSRDIHTLLVEEYHIRPQIASIPLAEREIIGERIGRSKQQVTDWFRNRRAKRSKAALAEEEAFLASAMRDDGQLSLDKRMARPPTGASVFNLNAMSLRIGYYSASKNYDGLCSYIDLENATLCHAVVSPVFQCLQNHMIIPLSHIAAMREHRPEEVAVANQTTALRFYLNQAPQFASSIRSHHFTFRSEADWTRCSVGEQRVHEIFLANGAEEVIKTLKSSAFKMLFDREIPDYTCEGTFRPSTPPSVSVPSTRSLSPALSDGVRSVKRESPFACDASAIPLRPSTTGAPESAPIFPSMLARNTNADKSPKEYADRSLIVSSSPFRSSKRISTARPRTLPPFRTMTPYSPSASQPAFPKWASVSSPTLINAARTLLASARIN